MTALVIGLGYMIVAAASMIAWSADPLRSNRSSDPVDRTPFWSLTAVLFGALAIGRLSSAATSIADVGRRLAISEGWYDARRPLQLLAIVGMTTLWFLIMRLALRHRKTTFDQYLPMAATTTSLILLASVRTLSFHYVDTLLERTHVGPLELGDCLELVGLVIASTIASKAAFAGRSATRTTEHLPD